MNDNFCLRLKPWWMDVFSLNDFFKSLLDDFQWFELFVTYTMSWYRKRKNEFASRWKRRMICYLERRESVKIENFCTLLEEFILRHFVTYSLGISHSWRLVIVTVMKRNLIHVTKYYLCNSISIIGINCTRSNLCN